MNKLWMIRQDGNEISGNAFFKQFTYAKNVIQVCMNIFDGGDGRDKLGRIRYVDEKTEGYNITPNFFINIKCFMIVFKCLRIICFFTIYITNIII